MCAIIFTILLQLSLFHLQIFWLEFDANKERIYVYVYVCTYLCGNVCVCVLLVYMNLIHLCIHTFKNIDLCANSKCTHVQAAWVSECLCVWSACNSHIDPIRCHLWCSLMVLPILCISVNCHTMENKEDFNGKSEKTWFCLKLKQVSVMSSHPYPKCKVCVAFIEAFSVSL